MFIARFVRWDGQPNEDYYYRKLEDAKYHFQLFSEEDTFLYSMILLLDESGFALDALVNNKRG